MASQLLSLLLLLAASSTILPVVSAAPCPPLKSPIPPSQDPWYTAPPSFASAAPGSVLRLRRAPGNLTAIYGSAAAYNILYRTTDSQYKPAWAVTTLFIPATNGTTTTTVRTSTPRRETVDVNKTACTASVSSSTAKLLSYQIPYDSADVDASPSYALYASTVQSANATYGPILSAGWFLNIPDYEGPLASFTAGVMSGHATIDSIRAVVSLLTTSDWLLGLPQCFEDVRYAMWGYSGGALASEWAAELQVQYAPELVFAGAALGGLTPNVTSVLETINGGLAAGLAPSSILGLTSQYPDVQELLLGRLKAAGPYNATGFLSARDMSLAQAEVAFAFHDIGAYFVDGLSDIITGPEVDRIIFSDGIMGYHGVPQMPLFAYKAIQDEISPVADTDKLVGEYCNMGANILYQRNTVGGHTAEATNGFQAALEWLTSVLEGTYAQEYNSTGCTVEQVTVRLNTSPIKF
ncbi:lipase 1 [Diplogelasinospora grovesii]|uniref:Lipase 1 n=1 Tax=Diplogelasinospora grovesii TaxID=303347 RepID=A0AAN6NBU4_9PEZI|nr:lipase 1 [Diplogelasinospora grovesii]